MKKAFALILALALCLGLAACSGAESQVDTVHKLGVITYNLASDEVIGIREYLQDYIGSNFEMVQFLYSESIRSQEEEMAFIQNACDAGVEGFLSFNSYDLAAEVKLCQQNSAYYLLASGTVAAEQFAAVEDNPWFLGAFGPGEDTEYQTGAEMARFFAEKGVGDRYFILSGGAPLGNEMHYQRTLGMLEELSRVYNENLAGSLEDLAKSESAVTVSGGALTVTVCPGYVDFDEPAALARETFSQGSYDVVMAVLPPSDLSESFGNAEMGIVDSYNTRNLQLFVNGSLDYVAGKYSSIVGPAFALMLNAVTGYASQFRENGKAVKITQSFWVSDSLDDYTEKYAFSNSAALNAYSFDDLSKVCKIFNPAASLERLEALANASSYEAVTARRYANAA